MLTQCPHCRTLFRVGPDHLKAAAGQVRCCRCHKIFNALNSLQDTPPSLTTASTLTDEQAIEELLYKGVLKTTTESPKENLCETTEPSQWVELQEPNIDNYTKPSASELERGEQEKLIEGIVEQNDGLDPEPDYFAESSESQMFELLDQDSSSLLLPEDMEEPAQQLNQQPEDSTGNIASFEAPKSAEAETDQEESSQEKASDKQNYKVSILKDKAINMEMGKTDYDSVPNFLLDSYTPPSSEAKINEEQALNFEAETSLKPRNKLHPIWLIGTLLLLLLLSGQLAWQFRENLIQHKMGRQTIGLLCRITGCEVPIRRALDKITIQGRNLSTHPDKPDMLFLQVNIINTADYEQPFPALTLSLYNDEGNLIARRTFSVDDYLPTEYAKEQMMPPAQPILLEMELIDPGKEVTGFSFDFY
jgi:predicted Zn finger-like uncharacterized protein